MSTYVLREALHGPYDGDRLEIPDGTADNTWFEFEFVAWVKPDQWTTRKHIVRHHYRYDGHDCRLVYEGPV